jgi:hypothetical protein
MGSQCLKQDKGWWANYPLNLVSSLKFRTSVQNLFELIPQPFDQTRVEAGKRGT